MGTRQSTYLCHSFALYETLYSKQQVCIQVISFTNTMGVQSLQFQQWCHGGAGPPRVNGGDRECQAKQQQGNKGMLGMFDVLAMQVCVFQCQHISIAGYVLS